MWDFDLLNLYISFLPGPEDCLLIRKGEIWDVCFLAVQHLKCDPVPLSLLFIYYESTKRKLKTKYICGCRCYERLQTETKEFTCLSYTELVLELEHLKIETRLITEMFVNVMGEWELDVIGAPSRLRVLFVYYKSRKEELQAKLMNESVWWETKS